MRIQTYSIILGILALGLGFGIWKMAPDELIMDEARYVEHLDWFLAGHYSDPDDPAIVNGPGYPAVLLLTYRGGQNYLPSRLLNVPILIGACLMFFLGARRLVPDKVAMWSSLAIPLNPFQLRFSYLMMSDGLAVFFACGFCWMLIESFHRKKHLVLWMLGAAFFLMALAMTRVIFGYVITVGLIAIPACGFVFREKWRPIGRATLVFAMAFFMCLPYLAFTYKLTGEHFTWSTTGGEFIYWIASPFDDELGDWQSSVSSIDEKPEAVRKNHQKILNSASRLKQIEQDATLRELGFAWMKAHPEKLARNLLANGVRFFSGFPNSFTQERIETICWTGPSYFFLTLVFLTIWPAVRGWHAIPVSVKTLALTTAIYVGGSALLPALPRYLLPVFPFALLWVAFAFSRLMEIRLVSPPSSVTLT